MATEARLQGACQPGTCAAHQLCAHQLDVLFEACGVAPALSARALAGRQGAPMARMQWCSRPGPSRPCAISKPRPSPSSMLAAGTRTSCRPRAHPRQVKKCAERCRGST